ncbi:MAG TPA: cytochrome c peroxidase [Myxococcales bacterium]|nr:cytochrome c peroxidase [Myxococcales bacterium]
MRALLALALVPIAACARPPAWKATPWTVAPPLGLPAVPVPADDPMTVEKVALGRMLYYDRRVATQVRSSCEDCHPADHGYAGRDPTMGFHRNSPTMWNRAYGDFEFWDGSAGRSLEQLVGGVLRFVNADAKEPVEARLARVPGYRRAFEQAFGREPDETAVVQAIASFCRTLLAGNAPYDRFEAGDHGAMNPEAQRGLALFRGRAGCASCHAGPNFTDEQFHDIGIGQADPQKRFYPAGLRGKPDFPELGRFNVSHRLEDRGAFKTPTLRELVNTGPYMHDGSFGTLEQVVDYYDRGGLRVLGMDPRIHPLDLSAQDESDLVAFLRSLTASPPVPPPPVLP